MEKDGKLATKKVEIEILKTELQEKTRQVQEQVFISK